MTRQEIFQKAMTMFYKDLPAFCDGLTPIQLERLELDLYRHYQPQELTVIKMVRVAGERNCGEEYFLQGDLS